MESISGMGTSVSLIDLNCDMGEGSGNDERIMPFISSASIACGFHAGDIDTMSETVMLARRYNVAIGAHVSFADKENFGRKEITLPAADIYELVTQQLIILNEVCDSQESALHHVKPHGALYNLAARDKAVAAAIASATMDFDRRLILMGLSKSHSITEAKRLGLKTASEVFADRRYNDNGSLVSRSQKSALIENVEESVAQVLQMIKENTVTTVSGLRIPIDAETICIHGDGSHAVEFAEQLSRALRANGVNISATQL